MVWVFQLQKVYVRVKCRCLSASSSAFYPLQHLHIRTSTFYPGRDRIELQMIHFWLMQINYINCSMILLYNRVALVLEDEGPVRAPGL